MAQKQLTMRKVEVTQRMTYVEMLETFDSSWNSPASAVEMASCGMYKLSLNDEVRCSRCCKIQSGWTDKDPVVIQHAEKYPTCPTVQRFVDTLSTYYCNNYSEITKKILHLQARACETKIKKLKIELKRLKDIK